MLRILLLLALGMAAVSCGDSDTDRELSLAGGSRSTAMVDTTTASTTTTTSIVPSSTTTTAPTSTTTTPATTAPTSTDAPTTTTTSGPAAGVTTTRARTAGGQAGEAPSTGQTQAVVALAATFGFTPSSQDLACIEDTGVLHAPGASSDESRARGLTALTICMPTELGEGVIHLNEAEGIVVPDEFRCFFPAQVVAASKLTVDQQIAHYGEAESPWDLGVMEEAAAACGVTLDELSVIADEAVAASGG